MKEIVPKRQTPLPEHRGMVLAVAEKRKKADFVAHVFDCFFQGGECWAGSSAGTLTVYLTSSGAEGTNIYIPHQDAQYYLSGFLAILGSCSLLFSFY